MKSGCHRTAFRAGGRNLGACRGRRSKPQPSAVRTLMVPSAAMGRDIPVAFIAGGPHAVYLLDAFDAGPDVSNWVTVGDGMNKFAGQGISVAAPAGGAYSITPTGSRTAVGSGRRSCPPSCQIGSQPTRDLPPVGTPWSVLRKAATPRWRSPRFTPIVSASRLAVGIPGARAYGRGRRDHCRVAAVRRRRHRTCGACRNSAGGSGTRPTRTSILLVDNNTRLWVFSPGTVTASDPAAMIGYPEIAHGTNRNFFAQYSGAGGANGHFDFPVAGDHGWSTWAPQLAAMSGDLSAAIR